MITFIKLLFKTIVDNKDISLVIETKLLKKKPKLQWSINGKIKNMLINLKNGHGSQREGNVRSIRILYENWETINGTRFAF